ncbi:MAG: hypothetical protein FJ125_06825 [Deltaproteobacteria bacterium]|nr:hypothetical protein [Deltaproteobacteria bacterium]
MRAAGKEGSAKPPQSYLKYSEDGFAGSDAACGDAAASAAGRIEHQPPRPAAPLEKPRAAAAPLSLTLRLHAHLQRLPAAGGREELTVDALPGETLGALLDRLAVPRNEVFAVLADGRRLGWDHRLAPGERLEVLPAISGG